MPANTKQRVLLPLSIPVHAESVARLVPQGSGVPAVEIISARCSEYIEQSANGGLMLSPDDVQKIEQNTNKPVRNGRDVVTATMAKAGRAEDGMLRFEGHLDPAWTAPMEALAKQGGCTVPDLIRQMFEMALENNWLYGLAYEGYRFSLSNKAKAFFEQRMEGEFSIDKLIKLVRSLEKSSVEELVPA